MLEVEIIPSGQIARGNWDCWYDPLVRSSDVQVLLLITAVFNPMNQKFVVEKDRHRQPHVVSWLSQTWRAGSAVRISAESIHPPIMIASLLMRFSHKSEPGTALFVKSYCPNSWSFFRVPSARHDKCETFVRSVPRSQTRWLVLHLCNNLCTASLTTLLYSNLLSFGSCEYMTLSKNPRHGLSDSADESCRLGLTLSVNMMQSPKCLHCWAREMVCKIDVY